MAHYPGVPVLTFNELWDGYTIGAISTNEMHERMKKDELFCAWLKRRVREARKRIEAARVHTIMK